MAGLFEKLGLVQREEDEISTVTSVPDVEISNESDIDVDKINYENLINSIYETGGITDTNSIFKIKAYIDILPAEMTQAKKQSSIAGILAVNNINIMDLIDDGNRRRDVLKGADCNIKSENESIISEAEADIEKLKGLIEAAEAKIADTKNNGMKSSTSIHNEIETINKLLEFANGIVNSDKEEK